jgi:EmrB/QacA subfamily drug resistance transporter
MMTASPAPPGGQTDASPDDGKSGIALAIIVACRLILLLDATIVNIALPSMQKGLGFSPESLSWVVNAYALAFGGLLLLGGRAGDILGRRRVFMIGIIVFTIASLLGGLATEAWMLVVCRAAQGVGAALATPSTLSLITTTFAEGQRRTKALAVYGSTGVFGAALGLILGGLLTTGGDWRWVMFVNVPIGLLIVLLTPKYVVESEKHTGRFDLSGGLLSSVGMGVLVYAFINAATAGWSATATIVSFVAGAVLLGLFLLVESRAEQPIVPLRLFANRNRASAYSIMLISAGAMGAVYFFLTQFVQENLGFNPLIAGLAFLPMAALMVPTALLLSKVLGKVGTRNMALAGALVVTLATFWLAQISEHSTYFGGLFGPMVVFGVGLSALTLPLTVISVSGVDPRDAGAASSLFNASMQLGGPLGLSILITVFSAASDDARAAAPAGTAGKPLADHVMASGISAAFIAATIFGVLTLLITLFIRSAPAPAKPPAAPTPVAAESKDNA